MPAIKSMSTDKEGNVTITPSTGIALSMVREDLIKSIEDKDTGLADKSKTDYDVYIHCYEDLNMKNIKRTVTLVTRKGELPRKEWWVDELGK